MEGPSLSRGRPAKRGIRSSKAGFLTFLALLGRSVVAMIWLLIFWLGLNFLFGLAVGISAGMHAVSRAEAIRLGGLAALHFSRQHDLLILLLSGLCVSIGMSSGRLLGARRRKPLDERQLLQQAIQMLVLSLVDHGFHIAEAKG